MSTINEIFDKKMWNQNVFGKKNFRDENSNSMCVFVYMRMCECVNSFVLSTQICVYLTRNSFITHKQTKYTHANKHTHELIQAHIQTYTYT